MACQAPQKYMDDVSRYVKKGVIEALIKRSNGFCECCGADLPTDRHHIIEFSKEGGSTLDNLIILCQSCHKQLPLYLDISQQHALQKWHHNNTAPNKSATHIFSNPINEFIIGSNTFWGCKSVLRINGQSVITPQEVNGRFYVNVVMLDSGFSDQMLVLGNKGIKNRESRIFTSDDSLIVTIRDKEILKIYRQNDNIAIELDISFNGEQFTFNKTGSKFPGMLFENNILECGTAIDYQLIGGHWQAKICGT